MACSPACPILWGASTVKEKPNIVIILADDLGYGDVSFNNPLARTQTPNIDNLAKSGISFSDAHAGGAVSVPSRYGLLTGRYYFRVNQENAYWGYLPPLIEQGRETIGTVLQKAGYTTACIGKWHLGLTWERIDSLKPQIPKLQINRKTTGYTNTNFAIPVKDSPNEKGFDYSFIIPASLDMPPYVFLRNGCVIDSDIILTGDAYHHSLETTKQAWDYKHIKEGDIYWGRGVWWRNGEMSRSFKVENCLDEIVSEGVSFIESQASKASPFLLYLPLTGPHTPWMAGDFKDFSDMGIYGDNIAHIDNVVLKINETLKRLHIDENTIVIFTSDNGAPWEEEDIQKYGHAGNGPWRGQKGDAWEGGHHVPLFIKWPEKIKKAGIYQHPVSLIDFIATFADLTHQTIEEKYAEDSFSFYPIINGSETQAVRDHIVYISSHNKLAIKAGEWKLIDNLGSGGFSAPAVVEPELHGPHGQLYHISEDVSECNNLYLRHKQKADELHELLRQTVKQGYSRKKQN
ncbi:MAG: arylsulfatase [Tannerella sp.]|nr:arylsulfatase [Tannerella sp.]